MFQSGVGRLVGLCHWPRSSLLRQRSADAPPERGIRRIRSGPTPLRPALLVRPREGFLSIARAARVFREAESARRQFGWVWGWKMEHTEEKGDVKCVPCL